MKKNKKTYNVISILLLIALLLLVACGDNENTSGSNKTNEKNQEVQHSDLSISFNEPEVTYADEKLYVIAQVNTTEDVFYYTLTNEDDVLLEETEIILEEQSEEDDEWRRFEIERDLDEASTEDVEQPILKMYIKENGEITNPNFIPIDLVSY